MIFSFYFTGHSPLKDNKKRKQESDLNVSNKNDANASNAVSTSAGKPPSANKPKVEPKFSQEVMVHDAPYYDKTAYMTHKSEIDQAVKQYYHTKMDQATRLGKFVSLELLQELVALALNNRLTPDAFTAENAVKASQIQVVIKVDESIGAEVAFVSCPFCFGKSDKTYKCTLERFGMIKCKFLLDHTTKPTCNAKSYSVTLVEPYKIPTMFWETTMKQSQPKKQLQSGKKITQTPPPKRQNKNLALLANAGSGGAKGSAYTPCFRVKHRLPNSFKTSL